MPEAILGDLCVLRLLTAGVGCCGTGGYYLTNAVSQKSAFVVDLLWQATRLIC